MIPTPACSETECLEMAATEETNQNQPEPGNVEVAVFISAFYGLSGLIVLPIAFLTAHRRPPGFNWELIKVYTAYWVCWGFGLAYVIFCMYRILMVVYFLTLLSVGERPRILQSWEATPDEKPKQNHRRCRGCGCVCPCADS